MTVIRKPAYHEIDSDHEAAPAATHFDAVRRRIGGTFDSVATPTDTAEALLNRKYPELETRFDSQDRVLWCYFSQRSRPSFTFQLLDDIAKAQENLKQVFDVPQAAKHPPVRYAVWTTETPGIWNLGGDLKLLVDLIRTGDREQVARYARHTTERVYQNATAMGLPLVTIALVKGDALGGGFEAALSCNVIIAERSAKFGLPEVMFNLFPGMGAYSLLARKLGAVQAEKIILSGRIYTAEELHELGIVDVLVEDGTGDLAVDDYVDKHSRSLNAHRAVYRVRNRVNELTREELMDVAEIWVDAAMSLTEGDLRRMERLVAAQDKRWEKINAAHAA